jgi:hypothetical protein
MILAAVDTRYLEYQIRRKNMSKNFPKGKTATQRAANASRFYDDLAKAKGNKPKPFPQRSAEEILSAHMPKKKR